MKNIHLSIHLNSQFTKLQLLDVNKCNIIFRLKIRFYKCMLATCYYFLLYSCILWIYLMHYLFTICV